MEYNPLPDIESYNEGFNPALKSNKSTYAIEFYSTKESLADVEEYTSMAKLGLIVLMDDEFGFKLTGDMIKGFKTVSDILALMN